MTIEMFEYPALYDSANFGSASAQRKFSWTIRTEYCLIFLVSTLNVICNSFGFDTFVISLLLFILAGLFLFRITKKLDQTWYRCRALAESVKTSTWRFSMRSHPFEDIDVVEIPKAHFRNFLRDILGANRHIAEHLSAADADQVTESMIAIRRLSRQERLSFYIRNRIDEQRRWYSKKSAANRRSLRMWIFLTCLMYIAAVVCLNAYRWNLPSFTLLFDPLIVLVASAIGWLQIKRHGELTASYNLTAHEIGIIRANSDSVESEEDLSHFVNEAELAFSREHTQWVARREAN